MDAARNRLAELMLRSPVRFGSLRGVPFVGKWIHKLSHRLLPADGLVWTQIRNGPAKGTWLELNPRTSRNYAEGEVERPVQGALAEYLKPGMVFYDLGANIGFFSLLASRLVEKTGMVFSFEPDPVAAIRLRRNVERNVASNVSVVEAGVGATTGEFAFLCADSTSPDRGLGSFAKGGEKCPDEALPCYALDDFVLEFPPPDAIKCDVEGAEGQVILGARNLLATRRPWILFEIHSAANGSEVKNFCRGLAYELRDVDGNHLLAEP